MAIETPVPEPEAVEESEPVETEITAEKETEPAPPAESTLRATSESAPASSEPKPGDKTIIDGKPHMWVPGFGWVKDEGGRSIGILVDGKGDINKQVGVMGGGTTVGNPGDELTGNKVGIMGENDKSISNAESAPGTKRYIDGKLHVWIPGFGWVKDQGGGSRGTVAEDMYENGLKIGIMGGSTTPPSETVPPASGQLEPIDGEINIVFVEVPEKNTTPPPYKSDTTPPTNP